MKEYSLQIAQILEQYKLSGSNHGLMNGNTGLYLFYYHLSRKTNNPEYEKEADELLDKVFSNLSTSLSTCFDNGLAGIGWGIEYLVQNGFSEGNTDQILEEIDHKVFKYLQQNKHNSFELTNGLTGDLFYLISRLRNPENPNSMAQVINRELLIQTINKLDELVTAQFPSMVKEINFDLFWRFPTLIYGLCEVLKLNIYNDKISCMFTQWLPYFEAYIPSMHINRLYIATVLSLVDKLIPTRRLKKQIQILLFATDFEILKTEIDPHALNIRFGWTGAVWLLQQASEIISVTYPNHKEIESIRLEIITRYNPGLEDFQINTATSKQFGLSEGLAGIGLMELLFPGILTGDQ